jgi:hypothetical protein
MTPGTKFSQYLQTHNVLAPLAALVMSVSVCAATPSEQALYDFQYSMLRNYKLIYTEEIFDFCVDQYGPFGAGLGGCMRRNDDIKQRVLTDAIEQLGRQSLAQSVYDECLDYYPMDGVKPIGECMYTRLFLRRELNDDSEERRVYQKCNLKWREQGYDAVDTCARSEVTYYRRWGRFNEE